MVPRYTTIVELECRLATVKPVFLCRARTLHMLLQARNCSHKLHSYICFVPVFSGSNCVNFKRVSRN